MKAFIRSSAIMLTTGVFMVGAYAPAIAASKRDVREVRPVTVSGY